MMDATRPGPGPAGTDDAETEEVDFETNNQELGHEHTEQTPEKFCSLSSGVVAFAVGAIALWFMIWMISTPQVPLYSTYPFFFIPLVLMLGATWWWHSRITSITHVIYHFLVGATFVVSCVFIAQMLLLGVWFMFEMAILPPTYQYRVVHPPEFPNVTVNSTNLSSAGGPSLPYKVNGTVTDAALDAALRAKAAGNSTGLDDLPEDSYYLEKVAHPLSAPLTLFYLSMVALPVPECAATYMVTSQSNRFHGHNKNFIINSLYVGLGYATGQSLLGMVTIAVQSGGGYTSEYYKVIDIPWYELLLMAFEYLIMSAPIQMLVGYGMGLLIAESREKNLPGRVVHRANYVAWCVRAFYYFFYFGLYFQYWGIAMFTIAALIEAALFIWYIKRIERTMPAEYLAKVGYLHAFGYGMLPQVEEYAQEQEMPARPVP
uniref:Uncharacterized protein n=1 Tax=Eutreptiella gymnastica TaxID=73025 RepID=A0A7S1I347_9EUGL|mmetsp:Transcript_125532/g.217668  ORF Transcript_125532/g.217668 Transcript_125532/m.217668 type:complete len:431 (+) Transcript_125532:54-1346(+)